MLLNGLRKLGSFTFVRQIGYNFKRRNRYLENRLMNGSQEEKNALFKPLVWIDCEMTGLDHHKDKIIEICCIVTDGNLNVVQDNCYESVIHYGPDVMGSMNDWCIEHHGASGLTQKVLESVKTREQVEEELLQFVKRYIPDSRVGLLAGNSVHMDRLFMLKDFPKVVDHLFYRLIDVSSVMEICSRHNPKLARMVPRKEKNHTAKSDILESIEQLQWYRDHYLKSEQETSDFVRGHEEPQMPGHRDAEGEDPEQRSCQIKRSDPGSLKNTIDQPAKKPRNV